MQKNIFRTFIAVCFPISASIARPDSENGLENKTKETAEDQPKMHPHKSNTKKGIAIEHNGRYFVVRDLKVLELPFVIRHCKASDNCYTKEPKKQISEHTMIKTGHNTIIGLHNIFQYPIEKFILKNRSWCEGLWDKNFFTIPNTRNKALRNLETIVLP